MRSLVNIPDSQIEVLKTICQAQKISRAELVRQAITSYIDLHKPASDQAFGLWKDRHTDGMAYQDKVRAEW